MRRKIIKQKTAYTLTLPIDWIRDNNLSSKDEVDINEASGDLIITTQKKSKIEEITLSLEKGTFDYYRIMIENHYLNGYDIIHIKLPERKVFAAVQQIVSNLIGFEILNQKEDLCTIGATAPPSSDQFTQLFSRCLNIITYTQETVKEDIENLTFKNFEEIEAQSKDARRFLLFCTRALHKVNITSRKEESFMHLLLERLILIEHNHYYLYKKIHLIKNPKVRKEVKNIYNRSIEMFNLFREMFAKKNLKNFAIINQEWNDIYFRDGHKLLKGCTEEESIILYHAMHLSKLMFLISQPSLIMLKVEKGGNS